MTNKEMIFELTNISDACVSAYVSHKFMVMSARPVYRYSYATPRTEDKENDSDAT